MSEVLHCLDEKMSGLPSKWALGRSDVALVSAHPVLLFYCTTGRNAWHSTWVKQYYRRSCFHLTRISAAAHAENNRTQGTVFYVAEQPAIEFNLGALRLFATQINSREPFGEFDPHSNQREIPEAGAHQSLSGLGIGAHVSRLLSALEWDSHYWKSPQPYEDSITMLLSDSCTPASQLHSEDLARYESYSEGSYYPLGWTKGKSGISPSAIRRISEELEGTTGDPSAVDDVNAGHRPDLSQAVIAACVESRLAAVRLAVAISNKIRDSLSVEFLFVSDIDRLSFRTLRRAAPGIGRRIWPPLTARRPFRP